MSADLFRPPGLEYVCRAAQVTDDDLDVYTYKSAAGLLVHVDRLGRGYRYLGTTVSGDPVFELLDDA